MKVVVYTLIAALLTLVACASNVFANEVKDQCLYGLLGHRWYAECPVSNTTFGNEDNETIVTPPSVTPPDEPDDSCDEPKDEKDEKDKDDRPGHGHGDDNHDHSGPPGLQ